MVEETVYSLIKHKYTIDFYYTADANNPLWTWINALPPTDGGQQLLGVTHTLPNNGAGFLQAVRVNFRSGGTRSYCSDGSRDDADDLVFAVFPKGV